MILRKLTLCLTSFAFVAITALQAQYLVTFQGPPAISTDPTVNLFDPATFTPGPSISIPGAFQFLSLANGSQSYLISNISGAAITVVRPKHGYQQIGNFGNPVNCAALSPDGSRLLIGENSVHIFEVGIDIDLTPNGLAIANGAPVIGLVVNYDSQTAYALATANGASYLAEISIPQLAITKTLDITGTGSGLALGPNGLLYVSGQNQIVEINPATLAATPSGVTAVTGTPGKLVFTPNGNYALAANQAFGTGPAILLLNLTNHTVEGTVPFTGLTAPFDNLYVASDNLAYAYSSGAMLALTGVPSLYTVQIGANGGLILNVPFIPGVTISALSGITLSNDLGIAGRNAPQFLFAVSNGAADGTGIDNLYRIDPISSQITQQTPLASTPGAVAYFAPTATTNQPVTTLLYGNNQNLLPGQTALPLVVRALDQNGLPISGLGVNFQASAGTVTPVNTATGIDGYAEAIFKAGSTPADIGQVTVFVTVGPLQSVYSINVATSFNATPAALTVVSGQGQLVFEDPTMTLGTGLVAPFVALAKDSNGNALPNALLTFAVTTGEGNLTAPDGSLQKSVVVPTDSTGQAAISFVPPLMPFAYPGFEQTVVTASAATGDTSGGPTSVSVNFYITTVPEDTQYCGAPPCTPPHTPLSFQVLQPSSYGATITGQAGATLPGAVQVYVYSSWGTPIPNVGLQANTGTSQTVPNASCADPSGASTTLTNSKGIASCDLVLNGQPGSAPLSFYLPVITFDSSSQSFVGYTLTITPGSPTNIKAVSGDNQAVPANSNLPLPLVAQITDVNGFPVPGATVSWTVASGSVKLISITNVTDANGKVPASGFVSSTGGSTATVQVMAGSLSATFTIKVSIPAANVVIVSGDNQQTQINTAFGVPIVVQVLDKDGNPASYASVVFAASGPATLSASTVVADANGQASDTVMAGAVPGAFTVIAASGVGAHAPSATFSLTILPLGPAGPTILNSASLAPGIAPGGLVTFMGTNLTPTIQGVVTDATQMSGYTVTFDGITAPILALVNQNGAEQINAQVPFEVTPGTPIDIAIQTPQGSTTVKGVVISPLAPGIFTNGSLAAPGGPYPQATVLRSDGTYASSSNPVHRGETITFFATGLGQTVPNASTGVAGSPGQVVGSPLFAGVNNQGAGVVSAVYEPGALGVYEISIQIPSSTVSGPAQPLNLYMVDGTGNGHNSPAAYIPIQ